jgi:hypothetical protein
MRTYYKKNKFQVLTEHELSISLREIASQSKSGLLAGSGSIQRVMR